MDDAFIMEYAHPVSQCTIGEEECSEITQVVKTCHKSFKVDNITVVTPPLLKIFYWQRLNLDGLNDKLSSECSFVEHLFELPTRQLNSRPLKIVFWFKSLCDEPFTMHLRRIQNCPCVPLQTRVGFNQFRYLYHCPHRRLINILQDQFILKPGDIVAMTMVTYYFMLGEYTLSYELKIDDTCIVLLHFSLNIVTFDPHKAILTRELIPVRIGEHRNLCQVIWVRNITMQNIQFMFSTKDRGFHLINPCLTVPRQSVWPLIVEFMPNDFENTFELYWTFGDEAGTDCCNIVYRYKVVLHGKGYIDKPLDEVEYKVPLLDYECSDFLYVVYPNKLVFETEINDERTLMVAVHNFSQNCMEFRWQIYTIMLYFSISFEPAVFTLKPHHKKLCVVRMNTFSKPLRFQRIPAILEIHRILDKSTQIAQKLLTEIESIDDPKWGQSSYFEHVLLHIDLKVKFPKLDRINIEEQMLKLPAYPSVVPVKSAQTNDTTIKTKTTTTIFEKLFWEYLSNTSHMPKNCQMPRNLTYEQVLKKEYPIKFLDADTQIVNKLGALNVLSFLTAEACRDLSKNHAFIPLDF